MNGPQLIISDFSSLNFRNDWRLGFQYPACYIQSVLPTDVIDIQCATTGTYSGTLAVHLTDLTGTVISAGKLSQIGQTTESTVYEVLWRNGVFPLAAGCYCVRFKINGFDLAVAPFRVADNLPDTVLFEVSNDEDEYNTIFGSDRVFHFRTEGVWLPSDVSFQSDDEVFRDQDATLYQLNAIPYETRILTIGGGVGSIGVPNWVARKVNKLLSCSSVIIDGTQYTRSEGTGIERTDIADYWPMYLYKATLEPILTDDNHSLSLPEQWLLAAEDGRIILTEDGKAIDMYPTTGY